MFSSFTSPKKKLFLSLASLTALLLFSIILAVSLGAVQLDLSNIFLFFSLTDNERNHARDFQVLLQLRLPRVLLAGMVGAILALAGAAFQSLFRNPLAEPYVLGISGGAALGAVLLIACGAFSLGIMWGAFAGALLATALILIVSGFYQGDTPPENVILSGVVINAFFSAIIVFVISISSASQVQTMAFWLMGDLSFVNYDELLSLFFIFIICGLIIYLQARNLNALMLGEETACQLGISPRRVRTIVILFASLSIGFGVSLSGIIGFVGIIVPHIVKMVIGYDNRLVIPASALLGASFLILADLLSRILLPPTEIPIGAITAIIGVPFFVFLLWRRRRRCC
ncbi:MAG: iron ABC transporter permease [Deltaproteobacteria bacterium]|nr:iron ABC transporter permease [Deltaproteobacteria bacterium]